MTAPAQSGVRSILAAALMPEGIVHVALREEEWEFLWEQARIHSLTVHLHESWRKAGLLDRIPPAMVDRFAHKREQNTLRNRAILQNLDEVLGALRAAGVSALVLKGLPLSEEYYRDLGARILYDLDLLIRPRDSREALEVLRRLGYEPYPLIAPARGESAGLFWRPVAYAWDAERVYDPERPVFVDLHTLPWEPHWHGFRVECRLDLWDDSRTVEICGVSLPVPCEEKTLVQLAVHYAFNALESHARLIHLLDIALLLRCREAGVRWDRVLALIRGSRAEPFCYFALELARRVCGAEIPESLRSGLLPAVPRKIVSWLEREGTDAVFSMNLYRRERSLIYALHWMMADRPREKMQVMAYALRAPWTEAKSSGDWGGFLLRMAQRLRHLALSLYARTKQGRVLRKPE